MPGGNLLAVIWKIASIEQSNSLLARIAKRGSLSPPAGFWTPGIRDAYLPYFLLNIADYNGKMEWSWLAAAEVSAYRIIGNDIEGSNC